MNKKKAKLVGFMLSKTKSLASLNMNGNRINDALAHDIIRGLRDNNTLKEFGLQDNCLISVSSWDEVLGDNKSLKILNLSENEIVNTFSLPTGLEEFILSSNSLDYNNLGRLLESLIYNDNCLKDLDLSHNPIHELLRFDDVLATNPQLQRLRCENIGLYDDSIPAMFEALKCSNLKEVSFSSNHLTDRGIF